LAIAALLAAIDATELSSVNTKKFGEKLKTHDQSFVISPPTLQEWPTLAPHVQTASAPQLHREYRISRPLEVNALPMVVYLGIDDPPGVLHYIDLSGQAKQEKFRTYVIILPVVDTPHSELICILGLMSL
jgi:hypothetical protein